MTSAFRTEIRSALDAQRVMTFLTKLHRFVRFAPMASTSACTDSCCLDHRLLVTLCDYTDVASVINLTSTQSCPKHFQKLSSFRFLMAIRLTPNDERIECCNVDHMLEDTLGPSLCTLACCVRWTHLIQMINSCFCGIVSRITSGFPVVASMSALVFSLERRTTHPVNLLNS